jgi:glycosyltransferase involved in cell wall biosynthesis
MWFLCRIHQYVIDSHTGAFLGRRWGWSLGLHRMLSRRALTTIVHNRSQEKIVKRWGCRYCVIGFTPGDYPAGERFPLSGQFNIAVISTFAPDEPVSVIFDAARLMPEINFYFTGKTERIPRDLSTNKPRNCHFTGYLAYENYVGLLRGVDVVMDLTTRDHTLLMGAFEAVSLGKPLIVSDWPILQEYFSLGTIHIPNTVKGVFEGVRRCQRELPSLQRDIFILQENLQSDWNKRIYELKLKIQKK